MPRVTILSKNTVLFRRHQNPDLFDLSTKKPVNYDNWHPAPYFHVLGPFGRDYDALRAYADSDHPYSFFVTTTKDIPCIDYTTDDMNEIDFYNQNCMENQFRIVEDLIKTNEKIEEIHKKHNWGTEDFIHWLAANGYAYIGPEGEGLTEIAFPPSVTLSEYINII